MLTTRPGDNSQHSHAANNSNPSNTTKNFRKRSGGFLKRLGSYKRVSTPVAALVVVGVLAAGFMVVSGRAAALGFHWPASVTRIFASSTARTAAAPRVLRQQPLAPLAVDQFFDGSTTNALTASKWAATNAGPFTSAFVTGNTAVFATVNGTGTGATGITVGGIRSEENFTMNSPTGTLSTGGTVATVNVLSGKKLDFTGVNISTTAGTGINKTGAGTLIFTSGGTFTGGFTLSSGTMVAGGVNAMGAGGALNLNGGILTVNSSAARDFTGKYTGGISIGGDVQFGDAANVPAGTGNMTFSNNVALGAATRTITIGSNATYTLGGILSSATPGTGLTVANSGGATGKLVLGGANTYTGNTTINSGIVNAGIAETANTSGPFGKQLANAAGTIILGGGTLQYSAANQFDYSGRFSTAASQACKIDTNGLNVTFATALSSSGGSLIKSGAGILTLSAANTYTGNTVITAGTLALTGTGSIANTAAITIGANTTFDVSGLSSTPTLGNSQTLTVTAATGTINGNLTMGSTTPLALTNYLSPVAPMTVTNGTLTLQSGETVTVTNNGAALTAGDYKLISKGTGGSVGGTAPTTVSVIGNGLAAGMTASLVITGGELFLHVAAPPETTVAVSGGNLVLTDGNGGTSNDTLTISLNGANVRITDPNNTLTAGAGATQINPNTVEVPYSSITGNIQVNTLGGNDTLTLNFAGGNLLPPGGLSYDGGLQTSTPGDRLAITGGTQGTVTYNYTNGTPGAGNVQMSAYGPGIVTYTGLEPISNSGIATDIIFNLPAGPTNSVTLGDDGTSGNTLSRLGTLGGTFETTDFANPTGSLTINRGNAADTFSFNGTPDFNASLTIGTGANPFSLVALDGALTLLANKNLSADSSGTLGLFDPSSDIVASGTGTISLTTTQAITLNTGASISVVNGNLTLNANIAGTTTGNFVGIAINAATLTTSGTGNISLTGKGGIAAGTNEGIAVNANSTITSTSAAVGAGTITLNGTGGQGTSFNRGVAIDGPATFVTSTKGDISITGVGGAGTSADNVGVQVEQGGVVTSIGAAKITIDGTGGNSGAAVSRGIGVRISDDTSQVTSSGGDISITGQGANGGSVNLGVSINLGALVSATGGAKITIDGTGGTGTGSLYGVAISAFDPGTNAPTRVMSDSGDILITGQAGNGTSLGNIGINTVASARIVASGPANITLNGTGANGTSDCYGVAFDGFNKAGTAVSAVNGNISITGAAGTSAGTDMDGVRFEDSVGAQAVSVTTTGTGTLTITGTAGNNDPTSAGINIVDDCAMTFTGATNTFIADTMDIGNSAVTLNSAGANALTLRQKTNTEAHHAGRRGSGDHAGLDRCGTGCDLGWHAEHRQQQRAARSPSAQTSRVRLVTSLTLYPGRTLISPVGR